MPYNSSFYIWNNKKKWINSFYAGMFKFCAKNVWNRIRHLKNLLRDTTEALRSFLSEPTKFSNLLSSGSLVLVRRGCLNNSPLFSIQIVFFFKLFEIIRFHNNGILNNELQTWSLHSYSPRNFLNKDYAFSRINLMRNIFLYLFINNFSLSLNAIRY